MQRITSLDDPNRCQAVSALGQCQCVVEPNKQFCAIHGGRGYATKTAARLYRLSKYRAGVDEMLSNDASRTLREEVGILRITLQELLTKAEQDENGLLMNAVVISNLIGQINNTLRTNTTLEAMIGRTINREEAIAMMDQVAGVIARHVTDKDVLAQIHSDLAQVLSDAQSLSQKKAEDQE